MVTPLLKTIRAQEKGAAKPRTNPKTLTFDRGDDDRKLYQALRKRGIKSEIPKRI